jgi:hypothetical protein
MGTKENTLVVGRLTAVLCVALFLGFAAPLPAPAQIVSGTIVGTVTDSTGGVVPGVSVAATNTATGLSRSADSDAQGNFSLPQLPPGQYSLNAASEGFKGFEVSGITLLVEQTARVDVQLEIGDVTEQIEVVAAGAVVQSETSSVGQVIDRERIVELPLNGRNFMQLANLSPGTAPAYNRRSATITNQSGRPDLATHVSGGRGDANSFLIDGVESRNAWFNSPAILLSVDAVQEFKVDRNMFSAEYGQGSGIISLVSKTGGNEFHGSAFEFLRNDSFDAANFFDNFFGRAKAPFRQNQFGATAGGPIAKNRVFFFGNWESLRSRRSRTLTALVPTQSQLQGDLSDLKQAVDPFTKEPYVNNRIPATQFSQVSQNFIRYTPSPNASIGGRNFVTTKSTNRDDDQLGARIDFRLSDKDSVFWRYTDFNSDLFRPGIGELSGHLFPYAGRTTLGQWTRIVNPNVVNTFKFSYTQSDVYHTWEITETSLANEIGLSIKQVPEEYGLPSVRVTGGWYVGGGVAINQGTSDDLYQFSDTLSWVSGQHTLKFGADIRSVYPTQRLGLRNNGGFSFDGRYTGNSVGDFLVGYTSAQRAQIGLGKARWRTRSLNFFISDDYKVTPRLTLNLGLRYEYDEPVWERDGKEGFFDVATETFVVRIDRSQSPIQRDIPGVEFRPNFQKGIWDRDLNNFAPRFGFAYRISDKTALRGGYGVFYSKTQGNEWQFKVNAPPLVIGLSQTGNLGTPNLNWDRDAFPDPASPDFPISTLSPFSVDPSDRTPYLQQWNLSLSHALSDTIVLDVAYVGSAGTKLAERVNINQATLPDPSNPTPIRERRPFPAFGDMLSSNWQENSNYNGLQVGLEKRLSRGMSFLIGYTWSHSIDTASRGSGGSWHQNARSLRDDRGNADFDVRQRFTASYVLELPFGNGKHFLSNASGAVDAILGGWSVNGIATFMTGNWFSPRTAGDRSNVGAFPFNRANRSCDGNLPRGQRTIERYFDTSCFEPNPRGTFGNSGRNVLEIPGLNNWDVSVNKQFQLAEGVRLQFRAEFFNFFNHTQLGQPTETATSRFFGQVRGALDARITQFGLKLLW